MSKKPPKSIRLGLNVDNAIMHTAVMDCPSADGISTEESMFWLSKSDHTYKKSSILITAVPDQDHIIQGKHYNYREIISVGPEDCILTKEELREYFFNMQANHKDCEVLYYINSKQSNRTAFDRTLEISNVVLDAKKSIEFTCDMEINFLVAPKKSKNTLTR